MGFLPNYSAPTVELHLTADQPTEVTVRYPMQSPTFTQTVTVVPGSVAIVQIPNTASQGWTANSVQANSVYASANEEFGVYMINRFMYTTDAALALPIEVFNTEYFVATYNSEIVADDRSQFAVYAAFDNTTITITPSNTMAGGHARGIPFQVVLNKGEGYFGTGIINGRAGDLTGTLIQSDKPVGMTNGNRCANVPPNETACDHIFEVAQPTQTWGKKVLVANLPNRPGGSVYRVNASQDNTALWRNGIFIANLDRGEYYEAPVLSGNHVFEATEPIFVTQYMTGDGSSGAEKGDPAMGNMIPVEQYLSSYSFSTVGDKQFEQNFVSIIADNADIGSSLRLDGVLLAAHDFTAVPGTSYSAGVFLVASGTHTTSSDRPHGITVSGYNNYDSYLYPGGGDFQFINPVGDANPPICELALSDKTASGSATDNRPSEDVNGNGLLDPGEDLNGNNKIDKDTGIRFVELGPGSVNLVLTVAPFTPGAPTVIYTLGLLDPGMDGTGAVVVTDGAGNTCSSPLTIISNRPPVAVCRNLTPIVGEGSPVLFDGSGSTDPDNDPLQYRWDFDNDGTWDTAWSSLPVATYTWKDDWTGTAKLEVSDGEFTSTDTTTVTVKNVAPRVNAGADLVGECNSGEVSFNGSFTDPGVLDTHSISWDFGDGSIANGTLTPKHRYCCAGTYTVTLTVTDKDGGVGSDTLIVEVKDTTAPVISAAFVPLPGEKDDDDEDDDDDSEGRYRIVFSASDLCDPAPTVSAVLAVCKKKIAVKNGQRVEIESDDDCEVEWDDGILEIESSNVTLIVTAVDKFGNKSVLSVKPPKR